MLTELRKIMLRDLEALRREIELYPDDDSPWREVNGFPNSAGTLALHLAGNLRHFIGAQLGGSGYLRDREAEFSIRGQSRAELIREIESAADEVARALETLDPARLDDPFPILFQNQSLSTRMFLLHLSTHLIFHVGQIDYHRRVVTGDRAGAGAVSIPALFAS